MTKKYRLTGCSKFFLFLLFAGPIAFLGAYYINTGDPMAGLKVLGLVGDEEGDGRSVMNEKSEEMSVEELRMKVEELSQELENCRNEKDTIPNQ